MKQDLLDARRLLCPMPVIKTQNKVKTLEIGDELTVVCTDPGAKHDIPTWAKMYGHEILAITTTRGREISISLKVGTLH